MVIMVDDLEIRLSNLDDNLMMIPTVCINNTLTDVLLGKLD